MRHSAPIQQPAPITQCAPICVCSPMCASSPITAYGPTLALAAIFASGAIIAVGCTPFAIAGNSRNTPAARANAAFASLARSNVLPATEIPAGTTTHRAAEASARSTCFAASTKIKSLVAARSGAATPLNSIVPSPSNSAPSANANCPAVFFITPPTLIPGSALLLSPGGGGFYSPTSRQPAQFCHPVRSAPAKRGAECIMPRQEPITKTHTALPLWPAASSTVHVPTPTDPDTSSQSLLSLLQTAAYSLKCPAPHLRFEATRAASQISTGTFRAPSPKPRSQALPPLQYAMPPAPAPPSCKPEYQKNPRILLPVASCSGPLKYRSFLPPSKSSASPVPTHS